MVCNFKISLPKFIAPVLFSSNFSLLNSFYWNLWSEAYTKFNFQLWTSMAQVCMILRSQEDRTFVFLGFWLNWIHGLHVQLLLSVVNHAMQKRFCAMWSSNPRFYWGIVIGIWLTYAWFSSHTIGYPPMPRYWNLLFGQYIKIAFLPF